MERRRFTRVPFATAAVIVHGAQQYLGVVVNLSLQGALIECVNDLEVGEAVCAKIYLESEGQAEGDEFAFELEGQAVRCNSSEVAVKFNLDGIDIDALTHMKYIIGFGTGNPDKVMEEYSAHLTRSQA